MKFGWEVLSIDAAAEAARIAAALHQGVAGTLRKRGAVIAISGGVDSAVCAALAVQALGPERVLALMLPERESSTENGERARSLAAHLGIEALEEDLTAALEALGCYRRRDEAVRRIVPEYGSNWRMKLVVTGSADGRINHFRVVAEAPDGTRHAARLPVREYLEIVAATNFKQRTRKMIEYFHADRLNYAVLGTPNRLEYDQGFFVKGGDGAADLKPIAHLYKTQVYALASHLHLPAAIATATPTTDTYSLSQGQDEFYFGLPYREMDLALWAFNHGIAPDDLAREIGVSVELAQRVFVDIAAKRRATRYLHRRPVLVERIAEIEESLA
ncbi:MAG: NAD(+) synthase [Acidobacteriota bacterium]|nr:NAD(+) synthase [Acidobacteriota bacterium]